MSFSCSINKNISLNPSSSGDSCNGQDMSIGIGGLSTPCYIYNLSDIQNLKFSGDNRSDDSLYVSEIVTDAAFYSIDFTSGEFQEDYNDGIWSQTLTLTINNINAQFEDLLCDSVSGKYLVAFRPNGSDDYRAFGWRNGATLRYTMTIAEDNQTYVVTITDESVFPLLSVYKENFNVKDKVYSPIFKPLYSSSICEQSNGANNGYAIAMYVVKVNSAGQALDFNNKLCQWSGNKQDAYKYNGVADGDYRILGTYAASAEFDGRPVRVYDLTSCPSNVQGSISVSPNAVSLNSTNTSANVTITSSGDWTIVDAPTYALMTPQVNSQGTTTATVYSNGVGGSDAITLQNVATREIVSLTSQICLIKVDSAYTYPNGTTALVLAPTVEGGSADYTYSISPSVTASRDGMNLIINPPSSSAEQTFTVTLTHASDANEVKTVTITILGTNSTASWQVLSKFCELV